MGAFLAMVLLVSGSAAAASTAKVRSGVNICYTDPWDMTPYSGTCGDENAWVQIDWVTPWASGCVNTLIDGDPGAC